jgi:membrane-bound lytic murein transglycosylase D
VARRYGTTAAMLAELNGLDAKKSQIAGKTLLVPAKQTVDFNKEGRSARNAGNREQFEKYYTVKKGDTLDSLAKRFKTSTKLLTAWNNLKSKVALKPGRRIIIAKFNRKSDEMAPAAKS